MRTLRTKDGRAVADDASAHVHARGRAAESSLPGFGRAARARSAAPARARRAPRQTPHLPTGSPRPFSPPLFRDHCVPMFPEDLLELGHAAPTARARFPTRRRRPRRRNEGPSLAAGWRGARRRGSVTELRDLFRQLPQRLHARMRTWQGGRGAAPRRDPGRRRGRVCRLDQPVEERKVALAAEPGEQLLP